MRKRVICILILIFLMSGWAGSGKKFWEKKPYTQWTKEEVQELFFNSPWAKKVRYTPPHLAIIERYRSHRIGAKDRRENIPNGRLYKEQIYHISWISALPWKQARVRYAQLMGQPLDVIQVERFLNAPERYIRIIIATNNPEIFLTTKKAEITMETYLQTELRGRFRLLQYIPPTKENMMPPLFIFPREEDGTPLITLEDEEVTFFTRFNNVTLKCKFKLKDMVVNGKLEI